ncbi:MAG: Rne/Rng family ribonuclease, partial [Deltaproteobacteria bacterium]|nr:Rne/Rng family ribonuclease [Deltaproteobacteria bacterium]
MSKRIIINASQAGEVWAVYVENGTVEEVFVESSRKQVLRGNIYRSHVVSIDPKLKAAFLDYGAERNGFVALKDIHPACYARPSKESEPRIQDVLQVGQPLLVQIKKEETGNKGAAMTTDVTLASAYTVISPMRGGEATLSRKIADGPSKKRLSGLMKEADPDEKLGVTVRTAAEGRESAEVFADLQSQIRAWHHIQADFQRMTSPGILFKESQLSTRMVRDHFTDEVDEILVDQREAYEELRRYCADRLPAALDRVRFYEDRLPLFVRYNVEYQINQLTTHIVELPSGGNVSVNHTEALTVFDVNSSRQSGAGDQSQMFLTTNCEAAEMIARQIRLRGVGGLMVIDFINMPDMRARRQVEKVFKEAIKRDRAHLEVGTLSRFCILELSRNRIQERSLATTHTTCPTCDGTGYVPSPNVVSFKLMNMLYSYAEKVGPGKLIRGKLPAAHALYLLNEKRAALMQLEERYGVTVEIEADFTQSLLAPNPFSEAGMAPLPSASAAAPSLSRGAEPAREARRLVDRRERRRGREEGREGPAPTPLPAAPAAPAALPPAPPAARAEAPVSVAQIVGYIPKAQLDRAEAASLLSAPRAPGPPPPP